MSFDVTKFMLVEEQQFLDEIVQLDGSWFAASHFERCHLIFAGEADWGYAPSTSFIDCHFEIIGRAKMIMDRIAHFLPREGASQLIDEVRKGSAEIRFN